MEEFYRKYPLVSQETAQTYSKQYQLVNQDRYQSFLDFYESHLPEA